MVSYDLVRVQYPSSEPILTFTVFLQSLPQWLHTTSNLFLKGIF